MNYVIHKLHLIRPTIHQHFFEFEVKKQVKRLDRLLKRYKKDLDLHLYVKREGRVMTRITAALSTRNRPVIVDESGDSIQLLDGLFDRLRNAAEHQMRIEKRSSARVSARKIRLRINENELEEE